MAVTREEIIEALKEMSLLEASELVKDIEETFGVSAAAPVAVAAAAPAEGGAAAEEKSDFDVVLEGFGDNKIAVIKVVREIWPGPEGGQGGRRGRSEAGGRGRCQGQGRGDQGQAGRGRRRCDPEVNSLSRILQPPLRLYGTPLTSGVLFFGERSCFGCTALLRFSLF